MRGDGGRDEDDFFEVKCPSNFFCPPEVTQMDGVKGSPEQANLSSCGLLSYFSTLPIINRKSVKC